jgi:hypothetical protein
MRRIFSPLLLFVCSAGLTSVHAQNISPPPHPGHTSPSKKVVLPEGVTEEMLAPPPVPRFMLEPPSKPLTQAEMMEQIREAELKAGVSSPKPPARH